MTTTVALAARDFIVVGADSLATTAAWLLDPWRFVTTFFDAQGNLKLGSDGKPLLKNSSEVWQRSSSLPVNQLPSVTKVFSLMPKKAAVVFAGGARIGEVSAKNLIEQFKECEDFRKSEDYTVQRIAEKLHDFVVSVYDSEIPQPEHRPLLELLLAGYGSTHWQPEIYRLVFQWDWTRKVFDATVKCEVERGKYNVIFCGQYDVIQRVVHGVDITSWLNLKAKCQKILNTYRDKIQADLTNHGHPLAVIPPDPNDPDLDLFSKDFGGVTGIFADVSDLSEQAGIEFVRFLITTMIKAQEFSSSIPTVGGDILLGLLTKNTGFRWVTKPYIERAGDLPDS